jgi:TPR repeat protein
MIKILLFILMTQLSPMAFADFESDLTATAKTDASLRELRIRADQNDAEAQFNLSSLYFKGQQVEQDYVEAAKWMQLAAEQGHVLAAYNLAMMYSSGQGVAVDYAAAAKWYQRSAEGGFVLAQLNLGVAYANGEGVQKNDTEAVKWFRLAAEQNDAQAQFNLGVMYANGQGTEQNLIESYRLSKLAAAQGHETANQLISDLTRKMTAKQIASANKPIKKKPAVVTPEKSQQASKQSPPQQADNKATEVSEVAPVQQAAATQPVATQPAVEEAVKPVATQPAAEEAVKTVATQPAAEEAVKPVAIAAVSAQSSETANYYVQIGAFKSKKQAADFMEKTRAKQGELDKPYSLYSNEGWERIHVGPYASQSEAQQSADALKVKLGYQPKVRKHD